MNPVAILPTGTANVASVRAAFTRLGATTTLTQTPDDVLSASALVIPGVGTFGAAMEVLAPFAEALRARVHADRPTLGICVGMQVFAAASDESPGVAGLRVLPEAVTAIDAAPRPQFGWGRIDGPDGLIPAGAYAYFAHSYALRRVDASWEAWTTEYDAPCVAACQRGATLLTQFHPELSGAVGAQMLRDWMNQ